MSARGAATPPGSPVGAKRVADRAVDNGWSVLYGRLGSYAALPAERHPKAARDAELLNALLPDGLTQE